MSSFFSPPPPSGRDFDSFNSTANSIGAAAIVFTVLSGIALIAIVIAVIHCLKRAGKSIPNQARAQIILGRSDQGQGLQGHAQGQGAYYQHHPFQHPLGFHVITNPHIEAATMEKFLSDIAKEKPIRFSPEQLAGLTQNFAKVLGSGGFGIVYKGEFPTGIGIAVKVLNSNTCKRIEEQFMAEVGTIGRTYHMNLVRLYGFCFDSTMRALVYEYMENGSLDRFLFGDKKQPIEWKKLHEIAIGTAKGLAYLHEECQQRIIHYDIKPGNVLLDSNVMPKVADFGLAKLTNRDSTHVVMSGCRGTPGYAAPELWTPYPVTHKCDVYSFGMLLFEIVARRRNHVADLSGMSQEWLPRWTYDKLKNDDMLDMLNVCGIEEKDKEEAERMVKVALWCVQYLPASRPLMSTVVRMLAGGVDIGTPPNPFSHLEDNHLPNLGSNVDSDQWTPGIKSSTNPSSQEKSYEIHPASI